MELTRDDIQAIAVETDRTQNCEEVTSNQNSESTSDLAASL
ncbi:MAG: hypothetical protein R3C11_27470 [Planctomycetaceae bacterium]